MVGAERQHTRSGGPPARSIARRRISTVSPMQRCARGVGTDDDRVATLDRNQRLVERGGGRIGGRDDPSHDPHRRRDLEHPARFVARDHSDRLFARRSTPKRPRNRAGSSEPCSARVRCPSPRPPDAPTRRRPRLPRPPWRRTGDRSRIGRSRAPPRTRAWRARRSREPPVGRGGRDRGLSWRGRASRRQSFEAPPVGGGERSGSTRSSWSCGRGMTCTLTSSPTRRAAAAPASVAALDRSHLPPHEEGDEACGHLLFAPQIDHGGLDHGVGGLDGADQTFGLDHAQSQGGFHREPFVRGTGEWGAWSLGAVPRANNGKARRGHLS